jgi:hypothetical protein
MSLSIVSICVQGGLATLTDTLLEGCRFERNSAFGAGEYAVTEITVSAHSHVIRLYLRSVQLKHKHKLMHSEVSMQ